MTRGEHRYHPYGKPGKKTRKNKPHFQFSVEGHMSNHIMDSDPAAKRAKTHDAQMIPGLGPREFGFPNSIITKLRYCDTTVLTGTSGIKAGVVFAANGLYDPDVTNAGHQPMFFDQFAAIYDQYVVLGSKITVTVTNTTTTIPLICVLNGDDDSTNTEN